MPEQVVNGIGTESTGNAEGQESDEIKVVTVNDILDKDGELALDYRQYLYLLNAHVYHRTPVFRAEGREYSTPEVGLADALVAAGYGEVVEQDHELWFMPSDRAEQWLLDQRGKQFIPAVYMWDRVTFLQTYWKGVHRLSQRDRDGYSNFQTVHYLTLLGLVSSWIDGDDYVLQITEWGAECARKWEAPSRPRWIKEIAEAAKVMRADYGEEPEELRGPQHTKEYHDAYADDEPDSIFTCVYPDWLTGLLKPAKHKRSSKKIWEEPSDYPGGELEDLCFDDDWRNMEYLSYLNGEMGWNKPWQPQPIEWYVAHFRESWGREQMAISSEMEAQTQGAELSDEERAKLYTNIARARNEERASEGEENFADLDDPWYYEELLNKGYVEELGDDFRILLRTKDMGMMRSSGPYKDLIEVVQYEDYLFEERQAKAGKTK